MTHIPGVGLQFQLPASLSLRPLSGTVRRDILHGPAALGPPDAEQSKRGARGGGERETARRAREQDRDTGAVGKDLCLF